MGREAGMLEERGLLAQEVRLAENKTLPFT